MARLASYIVRRQRSVHKLLQKPSTVLVRTQMTTVKKMLQQPNVIFEMDDPPIAVLVPVHCCTDNRPLPH